jgi:hypothetical protein
MAWAVCWWRLRQLDQFSQWRASRACWTDQSTGKAGDLVAGQRDQPGW